MGEWFEIKGQVCRRKTERGDDSPSLPRSHIHVRRFFFSHTLCEIIIFFFLHSSLSLYLVVFPLIGVICVFSLVTIH